MTMLARALLMALIVTMTNAVVASELVESTPLQVEGATTVDAVQAKQLFDEEALFVDLRKEPVWNSGRIPGAIWMDFVNGFNEQTLAAEASKDTQLVFYCSGDRCPRSSKASAKAVSWGYTKVYYFRDGYPAWKNAGYPVE